MQVYRKVGAAVVIAALVQGCSSRPREYAPTMASSASAETRAAFDQDVAQCHQLLVAGKLDSEGRLGSAGVGAAAGAATMVGGAAAASSAGLAGGAALASATVVLIPFVAIGGAWAMANAKRNKKERAIQKVMAGCLSERGHTIVGWEKTGRKMKVDPMHKRPSADEQSR